MELRLREREIPKHLRQFFKPCGLKPKDDCLIPHRVAMALQRDGWYLRSDIIWAKKNCMPESVTDRPTKAHEYLFLLAKSQRYYYDATAIAEPSCVSSAWHEPDAKYLNETHGDSQNSRCTGFNRVGTIGGTRNKRSVWTIPTKPCKLAHFATMPPALAEVCILAGTSERGCCPKCGKPWERVVEVKRKAKEEWRVRSGGESRPGPIQSTPGVAHTPENFGKVVHTLGWQPACACDVGEPVPCVVLDPFGGAGTTALVAVQHGRRAISIELNGDYCQMQHERIDGTQVGLL